MRASSGPGADRLPRLDALRGAWMLWMAAFHFAFDLSAWGLGNSTFKTDPFWTLQRTAILSGFLFLAGWGQGLAAGALPLRRDLRFWRRWAQIAGAALLVSAGSALVFPRSWIFLGVLHALVLCLPALRWAAPRLPGSAWLALALVSVLAPLLLAQPAFNQGAWLLLGLGTQKPITEDYVPLLPWLAPLALGVWAAGQQRQHPHRVLQRLAAGGLPAGWQWLARLGRWPLSFYLLHQPVLIGALMAGLALQRSMAA